MQATAGAWDHPPCANPQLLTWAREIAGPFVEEAEAKLGLKSTAKATAEENLGEAERGERPISRGILERAAATYRHPPTHSY